MTDGQPQDAAERVRTAVERTLQAGTARIRQTMLSPAGLVTATGAVDFVKRRATAVMTMPPHAYAPDPNTTTDVTMIIDGVDTYTEVIDRPGRWIVDRLASAGQTMSAGDPGLLLDMLRGTVAATRIDDSASEAQASAVFDVEVDLDRAIERAPDDLRRPLRESMDAVLRDRTPHQARVHLDGDGRLRSIGIALDATNQQPVDRLEVELFDLGADVAIELPDAASILDQDEMAALGAELSERFGDELLTPPPESDDNETQP